MTINVDDHLNCKLLINSEIHLMIWLKKFNTDITFDFFNLFSLLLLSKLKYNWVWAFGEDTTELWLLVNLIHQVISFLIRCWMCYRRLPKQIFSLYEEHSIIVKQKKAWPIHSNNSKRWKGPSQMHKWNGELENPWKPHMFCCR